MVDDVTARFLLTTIVQSMAAIWAIFFGLFIVFREMILNRRERVNNPIGRIHLDDRVKIFLLITNVLIFASIFFGSLGLFFFKDDGLINLTVFFSILSIVLLVSYFTYFIVKKI